MGMPRTHTDFGPQNVANVLDGMHATLRLPHEWSRRAGSHTSEGMPCDPCSPAARSWCLSGALDRMLGQIVDPILRARLAEDTEILLLDTARRIFGTPCLESLQQLNDSRSTSHTDVLDVIAEARATLPAYRAQPSQIEYFTPRAVIDYAAALSRSVNA